MTLPALRETELACNVLHISWHCKRLATVYRVVITTNLQLDNYSDTRWQTHKPQAAFKQIDPRSTN